MCMLLLSAYADLGLSIPTAWCFCCLAPTWIYRSESTDPVRCCCCLCPPSHGPPLSSCLGLLILYCMLPAVLPGDDSLNWTVISLLNCALFKLQHYDTENDSFCFGDSFLALGSWANWSLLWERPTKDSVSIGCAQRDLLLAWTTCAKAAAFLRGSSRLVYLLLVSFCSKKLYCLVWQWAYSFC